MAGSLLSVNGSARVALAAGVRLHDDTLHDELSGATHRLNATGAAGLAALTSGATFTDVCAELADRWATTSARVREDLLELLDDLDRYDLIEVRTGRALRAQIGAAWRRLSSPLLMGVSVWVWLLAKPGRKAGRRYPGTIMGLTRASARSQSVAFVLLGVLVPSVAVLVQLEVDGGDLAAATAGLDSLVAHVWAALAAFFVLTVLHELAHARAARGLGAQVLYAHSRGWAVSVVRTPLHRAGEALVGLAGPAAAFLVGGSAALALHVVGGQPLGLQTSYAATVLAIAAAHLLSLGPWSEDGRAVLALVAASDRRSRALPTVGR